METTEASNTFGGNLLVAQSGGPTAVINSSVAGVIQEAGRHEDIEEIYGGLNGIYGILNEELIDINESKSIEALKHTPAAALGTADTKSISKQIPIKWPRTWIACSKSLRHTAFAFLLRGWKRFSRHLA